MSYLFFNHKYSAIFRSSLFCNKRPEFAHINKYQMKHYSNIKKSSKMDLRGYLLLTIPVGTFFLGCWQVHRRKWKLDLIAELNEKTKMTPVSFPERLDDIDNMEYVKVKLMGTFDHDKEIYLGPRSLVMNDEGIKKSSGIFSTNKSGYNVITPFRLSDGSCTILANRGWVPTKNKDPTSRLLGQIKEEVEITGVIRKHEDRSPFMPKNIMSSNDFFFRELPVMAEKTGSSPIFVDVVESVQGGPIGSQTLVSLRNEHLSYILTWYSLSACTSVLWYWRFIKGKALM